MAYYSRKLAPRDNNYATIEKECLSIKAAIQNFRVYIVGSKFTVVTDHKALKWLNTMKDNRPDGTFPSSLTSSRWNTGQEY